MRMTPRSIIAVLLSATFVLRAGGAYAAGANTPDTIGTRTESQKLAGELLAGMAKYLAALQGFEVELVGSYDAVQESGQKIEFSEVRAVAVARPDRLRVERLRSDGAEDLIVFDGKTMHVFDGRVGVFAQAPQPGSLDDAVVYFVRELGMQLPLAALLSTRFPAELERRVRTVDYVEYTEILPVPAHHIAGRTGTVDFQVWIADGDQPLPLRIVITYVNEPGQPQFRAQFLGWKQAPPVDASLFRFSPPADARQIAFAVQVPDIATGVATPATGPMAGQP
jgi:hypothetical protein